MQACKPASKKLSLNFPRKTTTLAACFADLSWPQKLAAMGLHGISPYRDLLINSDTVHIHIRIHTHIYIYIYTHIHIRICINPCLSLLRGKLRSHFAPTLGRQCRKGGSKLAQGRPRIPKQWPVDTNSRPDWCP